MAMPFDHQPTVRPGGRPGCSRLFDCLPAIALIGVIFILAGPQVLRKPTDQRVLTNIQFCFDVSGSMSVGPAV